MRERKTFSIWVTNEDLLNAVPWISDTWIAYGQRSFGRRMLTLSLWQSSACNILSMLPRQWKPNYISCPESSFSAWLHCQFSFAHIFAIFQLIYKYRVQTSVWGKISRLIPGCSRPWYPEFQILKPTLSSTDRIYLNIYDNWSSSLAKQKAWILNIELPLNNTLTSGIVNIQKRRNSS